MLSGTGKGKIGYAKIKFCADRAAKDGLQYSWVDTCCINKATSDEVGTAINSMFYWNQRAKKCYVYLSDVQVPDNATNAQAFPITWKEAFRRNQWFKRGWTLQELLAPPVVEFYSEEGKLLGSKISLEHEIYEITGIPIEALRGRRFSEFSINERVTWTANRITTLKEDKVYCLLGIFGVFLPLLYREGEAHASKRLNEEIQKRQREQGSENLPDAAGTVLYLLFNLKLTMCNLGESQESKAKPAPGPREHTHGQPVLWDPPARLGRLHTTERVRKRLILHLRFSAMEDREERIVEAMADTFQWIFQNETHHPDHYNYEWNSFVAWLEGRTTLYWITGKAGSGKSTIMKFIHQDPRTMQHLQAWASGFELFIAGHFFWNSGVSI